MFIVTEYAALKGIATLMIIMFYQKELHIP